jgi:kumamolisin
MPAPQESRPLADSEIAPFPKARLIGKADANETVQVMVIVRRKPGAPPLPDHEYWMRTPPGSRKFLSPEEFAAQYGAEQKDIDAVVDFGRSNGLTVLEAHAGRRSVILTGTVAQMNAAFGVELQSYEAPSPQPSRSTRKAAAVPTQTYRGYSGAISLPQAVADLVELVAGLDNRRTGGRNITWMNDDPANFSTLTVAEVANQTYNFPNNGAQGQTIGIVSIEGGYDPNDLTTYFAGLTPKNAPTINPPKIIPVPVNGGANQGQGNDFETLQDICISGTVAVGATIVVYFVGLSGGEYAAWLALLNQLLVPDAGDPPVPSVMTSSYYLAPTDMPLPPGQAPNPCNGQQLTGAQLGTISTKFQELATRGITFFIAAGDKGSASGIYDGQVHVQYPGSDPWVTSCGGTVLGTNSNGALEENVWNDTWDFTPQGIQGECGAGNQDEGSGATGGGVSDYFPLPAWQNTAGVPPSFNDGKVRRGVPDIAGNASPNSGYPMCAGGQAFIDTGTSAVAPLYAGLAACLNAFLEQPIGFLNPTLYTLGNQVCRDITFGNNLWNWMASPSALPPPPGCSYTQDAYSAGPGWDACTGWGVVNGFALLNALTPKPPPPDPCTDVIQRLNQEIQALGGIPVSSAAAWKAQLLSCLQQGKITQAQYTAAINEIDNPPKRRP